MRKPLSFLFNTKRDADILEWLTQQPNKSRAVRDAIRAAMRKAGQGSAAEEITLADVMATLERIEQNGIIVHGENAAEVQEPADIAANLDDLLTQ